MKYYYFEPTNVANDLIGGSKNDFIDGRGGWDVIEGNGGNDMLYGGGWGRDIILGGSGNDIVVGSNDSDTLRGGSGSDYIAGGGGNDYLSGGAGVDFIFGVGGHNILSGGEGNDYLAGGWGNDALDGGEGDDFMYGGGGANRFLFTANSGDDTIGDFNVWRDVIDLRLLPEAISYRDLTFTDKENGFGVTITHEALNGSIELMGVRASQLSASNFAMPDGSTTAIDVKGVTYTVPADRYEGSNYDDFYLDGSGDTHIFARGGRDEIFAGEGDDTIDGGSHSDVLYGEEGNDTVYGRSGSDRLFGGEGDDVLDGGINHDMLHGGTGDDRLIGGDGNDFLIGGEGNDTIAGGRGADHFMFKHGDGNDTITDFTDGQDDFDFAAFEGLTGFDGLDIEADGTTAVIDLTSYGGGVIRLENTSVDVLDASDFVFHESASDMAPIDGA